MMLRRKTALGPQLPRPHLVPGTFAYTLMVPQPTGMWMMLGKDTGWAAIPKSMVRGLCDSSWATAPAPLTCRTLTCTGLPAWSSANFASCRHGGQGAWRSFQRSVVRWSQVGPGVGRGTLGGPLHPGLPLPHPLRQRGGIGGD